MILRDIMTNKIKFLIPILFLVYLSGIQSQNILDNSDSLLRKLNTSNVKEKIQVYIELVNLNNRVKPEKSIEYGKEALNLAHNNNFKKEEADLLYLIGFAYHIQSMYQQAYENYEKSLQIREKIDDTVGVGEALNRISLIYNVKGEYEKALDYCQRAIEILEKEEDRKALARAYNNLGIIYYVLNDYKKAEELSLKALKFSESVEDNIILAVSHEHMSLIYINNKDFEKATYHVKKSLELRELENDKSGLASSYENLALIYRNLKKFNEALVYYNQSIEIKKEINSTRGIASSLSGIGITYAEMGNYEKSLIYLKQALDMRKQIGDKRGIVSSLNRIAEVYSQSSDFKNAYEFQKLAKLQNDSLLNDQKNKTIAELQESFERERREREILLLQKENSFQVTIRNYLIIIVLLLSSITVVAILAYRSKRKLNTILTDQNNEITRQKEELQTLNQELKEVVVTKDKFFSIIAHDLKNPFQGLIGSSEFLSNSYDELSEEEKATFIDSIKVVSHNTYKLLENLLEWANIQTGKLRFNPESINLLYELNSTISLIKQSAKNKRITFDIDIDGDIIVLADKFMIQTVIRNLLSNAVKFTNPGGSISLITTKIKDSVQIMVADTGIGISKGNISKLFNMEANLSRKGTANEVGTGLGLLICFEMIEMHGTIISVESEEGKGSKFFFSLQAGS